MMDTGAPAAPATPAEDLCSASAYQGLVGQDRAAVAAAGLEPGPKTRIYGPTDMITEDFRPDRINVVMDGTDRVLRVTCG